MVVHVAVPLPLDQCYSYRVPPALAPDVQVGCRVLVPFGPRQLTGVVVRQADAAPDGRTLKPLLDVLDDTPALTDEMLRLTRWIADYYVCGWGEVIRAALPSGTDIESRLVAAWTGLPPPHGTDPTTRALLRHLEQQGEVTVATLRKVVTGVGSGLLRRLEAAGFITLQATLTRPKTRIKREKHLSLTLPPHTADEARALLRGARQKAILDALLALADEGEPHPRQADVLARAAATPSSLKALIDNHLAAVEVREVIRSPLGDLPQPSKPPDRVLHPAQEAALRKILAAIGQETFAPFLLHGVTGSGKTEVYIAALKAVIAQGKTAIILVPEIALTPQTVTRFRAHFGDRIAVLHSRMSLGERYDAWRSLRSGRFSVVIGPRSAVLAPLSNLGLIVVDEEHEQSYKQFDPAPRYHARDVAVMRASMNGAVCVLGSATPSLESYTNARWGKYILLEMPDRVPVPGHRAAPLPVVNIIDLTLEQKKHQLQGVLSNPLRTAIEERLARQEQVILLQNRRGYAPILECESCGWCPTCHDCSVTMTYHKARRQAQGVVRPHLQCHYCGRTQRLPRVCPKCTAATLSQLGTGTQRVEEELASCFAEARILRMDLDTTSRKDAHHRLLERFGRGEADILLGTQMVAKGLDFGRVTLVGVINADMGLLMPDFRAEERTFQLLTQVAGRAGRAKLRGEVILQTRNPDHLVLRRACMHDYLAFVEDILPERQTLHYPPFARMVGVVFRGPHEQGVEKLAQGWTQALQAVLQEAGIDTNVLQVLGPQPAFIGRVKRQYRYHTLLKASRQHPTDIQTILRDANTRFGAPPRHYHIAIDVDAVGLF